MDRSGRLRLRSSGKIRAIRAPSPSLCFVRANPGSFFYSFFRVLSSTLPPTISFTWLSIPFLALPSRLRGCKMLLLGVRMPSSVYSLREERLCVDVLHSLPDSWDWGNAQTIFCLTCHVLRNGIRRLWKYVLF